MGGEATSLDQAAAVVRRYAAAVRGDTPAPHSPHGEARRRILACLEGRIGALPPAPFSGAPPDAAIPAAGVLAVLQYDPECLATLVEFEPAEHRELLSVALRVLPRVSPPALLAHRAWVMRLVAALLDSGMADRFAPFLLALHGAGHLALVAAIRGATDAARLPPADRWRLDASDACWRGDYDALRRALADRPAADDATRVAGDLLAAIASGADNAGDDAIAALDAVRATPNCAVAMRDVAARWKAELLVRRGAAARLGRGGPLGWLTDRLRGRAGRHAADAEAWQAVREASDHPVLRLVTWIALLRQPDDGRREVFRDFHEWVIAGLQREGVAGIEPLARAWRQGGGEATLWQIIALFGGNRGDTCTVVEDGRLRALDLRTARQEAVEIQRRLRQVGIDATLRAFEQLATQWPGLVVFRTYRAELLLWSGQYEAAAALFDEVRRTSVNRWAQIGLGASLAFSGQPDEAERVWDEGARVHRGTLPGEASHVYRAEVAMAAGRLDAAAALLDGVLAAKPTRLRGWLLRAELAWLRGDPAAGRAALLQAAALCPGLADAAGPLALADLLEADGAPRVPRDAAIERCRSWRAALRGNAGSWLFTWYDGAGEPRAYAHASAPDLLLGLERMERIGRR